MKRLFLVLTLALGVSGCANLPPILNFVTTGVNNPVTPDMVYRAEQAMIIAVSGLKAYKNACIAKTIDQSCRVTIGRLQVYTRQLCTTFVAEKCATGALPDLRQFVRSNDQINAVKAYNLVSGLLDSFKSTAVAAGVN